MILNKNTRTVLWNNLDIKILLNGKPVCLRVDLKKGIKHLDQLYDFRKFRVGIFHSFFSCQIQIFCDIYLKVFN